MNILEELYYGNINPNEKCFDRNSEYGGFVKTVSDNEKKLTAFLQASSSAQENSIYLNSL